jgi:ABC-type spermidine/putrescine transport systems, ATPase components
VTGVVDLNRVRVEYDGVVAVEELSLSVRPKELFCLLGPSGCGKTTTLRTIAGFETPVAGSVALDGSDVTGVAPYDRDCATVFQNWALFPNKTVLENVAFGPKMAGVPATERQNRAIEHLETVEMAAYADDRPAELSGGQKQRVALARGLAVDPDVLLLDEPLSNLDKRLRETMQLELKQIQERLEMPMLYVTHDQNEAFTLADRIGVMNGGELIQVGPPETVYSDPVNQFVESFLGSTNFIEGRVAGTEYDEDHPRAELVFPSLDVERTVPFETAPSVGDGVTVSLRPETVDVAPATASPDGGTTSGPDAAETGDRTTTERRVTLTGTVSEVVHRGSTVRQHVTVGGESGVSVFVERPVTRAPDLSTGDRARLSWDVTDAYYFGPDNGRLQVRT